MEINVRFLDNLRLEAKFDDFTVITDQPIRYKGDGTAPSPFDYFLASSALCAAYFVKVYCQARDIPTGDIRISQNNMIDPENRYQQTFEIKVALPPDLPERHRQGILQAIERCTVKKVVQTGPVFAIKAVDSLTSDSRLIFEPSNQNGLKTHILGKDAALEDTIETMTGILAAMGIKIEIASWRNIVSHVWSVHIRDASSPLCFTNGKGASKESALCSALGEYIERLSCNYFYNDYYLGAEIASRSFVHYPDELWFMPAADDGVPAELFDARMRAIYDPEGELRASHLIDMNAGTPERGICAQPFVRQSDQETVYVPVNLVGNLYVSNGMSAGNSRFEARVQALSEIFERAVKKQIIEEELALPDVPQEILQRYPAILAGIRDLEEKGYPVLVKDASLGGRYPVMCVTLMNPRTGGIFASFGAHPKFEVALERSLTELLQGRSFEGLGDVLPPTFNRAAVQEPNNFVEHFIDSNGVVSWRFFSSQSPFEFCDWNLSGSTEEEFWQLMAICRLLEKEVYIADYEDLGSSACRILVPGYSEIYPIEDLVWDNTNKALDYRDDILRIHRLDQSALIDLAERLESSGIDNYTMVSELIGIAFDENSVWGQLDIGELKLLIYLAIGRLEEAKELVDAFLTFNECSDDRRLFYRALDAVLVIFQDEELELDHYADNLIRMFGEQRYNQVVDSVRGRLRFHGLEEIDDDLRQLEKHQRLLESYRKLHDSRHMRQKDTSL